MTGRVNVHRVRPNPPQRTSHGRYGPEPRDGTEGFLPDSAQTSSAVGRQGRRVSTSRLTGRRTELDRLVIARKPAFFRGSKCDTFFNAAVVR